MTYADWLYSRWGKHPHIQAMIAAGRKPHQLTIALRALERNNGVTPAERRPIPAYVQAERRHPAPARAPTLPDLSCTHCGPLPAYVQADLRYKYCPTCGRCLRANRARRSDLEYAPLFAKWGTHPHTVDVGARAYKSEPQRQAMILRAMRHLEQHDGRAPLTVTQRVQNHRDGVTAHDPPRLQRQEDASAKWRSTWQHTSAASSGPKPTPKPND